MSISHRYYPTREDRELFQKLVATVRRNPDRFREAGTALDAYYSPELVRLRHRARYEAEARAFSGSISKAATHPAIGPYRELDVSLAVRFNCAWRDTFFVTENEPGLPYFVLEYKPEDRRYRTALFLLGQEDQIEVAERRVLMGWLKLDAGRGKIEPRITAFQSLESSFSEEGYMPISQPCDPAWRAVRDRQIGLAEEGFWGHHEARWIELAREALGFLEAQPDRTRQNVSEPSMRGRGKVTTRKSTSPTPGIEHPGYMPARWFYDEFGIPAERLRAARRAGNLSVKNIGKKKPKYLYSVKEAKALWPEDNVELS